MMTLCRVLTPLLMAVALLTRIPVTQWLPQEQWKDKDIAASVLWYPAVGLLIATILVGGIWLLPTGMSPWVVAMTVVTLWVVITGALHLDGLADCVDAMYAGHAIAPGPNNELDPRKQKILLVLKDPRVGPMAVIALVLVLLFKVVLVASLLPEITWAVLSATVIPRVLAGAFITFTPYTPFASTKGIGATMAEHVNKYHVAIVHLVLASLLLLTLPLSSCLILLLGLGLWFFIWRRYWMKLVGGFVGDAIGAFIEVGEVLVLFLLYCVVI